MKIYQNKNTFLSLAIISAIVFTFAQTALAQQLKPTEIIYSRLQPNLQAAPTGANSPTIWAVGQDGANDRKICDGMQPRISDDGRYLLYKKMPGSPSNPFGNPWGQDGQLWVRDLANNSETMILTWSNTFQLGYYFSPASNQGNYEIILSYGTLLYKMNRDGTSATPLAGQFERDNFPVARRGDSLIAAHGQDSTGLITLTLDTANRIVIPNTLPNDYNPSWSNDNQFIGCGTIFPSNANPFGWNYPYPFAKLSKIKPDGTGKTQLVDLSGNQSDGIAFGTVWTDDNSKIIVAAKINDVTGLYAISTNGSQSYTRIPISAGNAPDWVGGIVQPRTDALLLSNGGGLITDQNGNSANQSKNSVFDQNQNLANQYSLVDSIGEPVAGAVSSSGNFSLASGFWALPNNPGGIFIISGQITLNGNPLAGVTVSLSGSSAATTTTNSSGFYTFTDLADLGNYTVTPTKAGNINGITSFDATLVLRCVAAGANCALSQNQLIAAEVSNDGNVTSFDATQILRFVAANGANANTGQTGNWKFTPASTAYSPLTASQQNQNYEAILIGEVSGDWHP